MILPSMCHPDDQTHFLPFRIALRKTIVCMKQNWAISLAKQGINLGCQKNCIGFNSLFAKGFQKILQQQHQVINGREYCVKRDCPDLTEILSMINGAPLYQPAQPLPLLLQRNILQYPIKLATQCFNHFNPYMKTQRD